MLVVNSRDKTIKHTFNTLGALFFCIVCTIMLITTGLLIAEYQFFREQSRRVVLLQDEYQMYIQAYKEACSMHKKKKSLEAVSTSVDIIDNDDTLKSQFNVVNRDALYLRDSALSFGKANNLESLLCDVYDSYDVQAVASQLSFARAIKQGKNNNRRQRLHNKTAQQNYTLAHYRNFTLRWPIDRSQFWLSSKFGPRKKKNDKQWGFHHGIDLAALKGTAVYAAAKGVVIESSYTPKGYGNSLVIAHNERFKTRYAHLDSMLVTKGQFVSAGQIIGHVGDTGYVHGKKAWHLHFEVIENCKCINPLRNLSR